ncbi:cell wall metabolism sensor histidine kinase WalK [Paenibacillus sp. UNC499MF]|uniref:sensor histidine kinase n=1 Tax=Paenibacillus sp. UNC499MF TaxID=1502751 RepID=UPI00089FF691|nr:HAMP domain-containing sensor histidine kinase [Paenibacillus sp. UNC499MF]SEF65672.1 Signal transduction histidine kinase [Paenibacillus sp. UNC499MF]
MRISLKWKFALFIAALLLFAVGVLSVLVLTGVHRYQKEEMEKTLNRQAEIANNRIGQQYVTGTRFDPQTFMQLQGQNLVVEIGAASGMRFLLYDMTGAAAGDSLPMAESPDVSGVLSHALNNKIVYKVLGDTEDYLAPVRGPDGQIGVLHFQVSLAAQNAFYRNLQNSFLVAGSAVLLLSFVLGLLYMNRQAKAIRRLKEAADDIRIGEFIAAPPFRRKDELGSLSAGIYEMSRALQASLRTQQQFINNISHELKTPLTSIRAYTDLLHMYEDDPGLVREARDVIDKEAVRLYELVEKVLKLAALEKYEFEQQPENVRIDLLLEDLASRMKGKAEKFGVTISHELFPAEVWADRESLIQIFLNLLDNAIKYNVENGTVLIRSRTTEEGALEIEFTDTGLGIPEDRRERIFEPFYTVNKDRARKSGGSGLGLSLVKQLVNKQQGQIRVEHPVKGGTSFIVTLPLGPR